jgi:lipopolysaccharide export system permease protein
VVCCYVLNLWLVPVSYGAFREYQFEIRNRMAAFLLQEGVFTPVSDDLTVYVRRRDADGTLHGVLVDDARQANSHATILAETGHLVNGPDGPRVLLQNGSREELDRQTGRLDVLTFAENSIDLASGNKSDEQRYRDVAEMSMTELLHPEQNALAARDRGKFLVEAHRRLCAPLTAASFALIALVGVLTGAFRRHGGLLRPVVAIFSVVGLLALGLAIQNLAARAPVLIPLMWVHAILPGVICGWVLLGPQPGQREARVARLAARTA